MTRPVNPRLRTLTWGAIPVLITGSLLCMDHIPGTSVQLTVPYAAEGPGPTIDTLGEVDGTPVVEVSAPRTFETSGQLNMTTVAVRTKMTLAQALARWIMTDDSIVPISTVIPQGYTDEEITEANQQAFTESESAATVAAMEHLRIPVKVVVAHILHDSPAVGVLEEGDVITAVDGQDVATPGEVQEAIRAKEPGQEVTVEVERGGKARTGTVTLAEHPHDKGVALLGVSMTSTPKEDITVNYNLQDVGGPSAGMMFSLAVIDKLSPGELTGGKFVAGTGTIAADGTVGPIGGIAHKVRAAKDAGAQLFLAPSENCAEATSRDTGDMVVARVDTLDDAIAAMDSFARGDAVETCAN